MPFGNANQHILYDDIPAEQSIRNYTSKMDYSPIHIVTADAEKNRHSYFLTNYLNVASYFLVNNNNKTCPYDSEAIVSG